MSTFERMDLTQFDGATPGPWIADPTPETLAGGDYQARVIAPGVLPDGATAIITGCPYNGNRNHLANIHWPPNAALIAAAPDLLVALRSAYAEIDRLRANALEWVTVTDDPATLPEVGRRVIVEHRNSGMTFAAEIDGPDLWALGSFDGERDTYAILSPGDRWAYIPEVTA